MIFLFTRPPLIPRTPYGDCTSLHLSLSHSLTRTHTYTHTCARAHTHLSVSVPSVRKPKPAPSVLIERCRLSSRRCRLVTLASIVVGKGSSPRLYKAAARSPRLLPYSNNIPFSKMPRGPYLNSGIKFKKIRLGFEDRVKEF